MPSVLLMVLGMYPRTVMSFYVNFLPSLSVKLGESLATSLNSSSIIFAHLSRLALYVDMFYWRGHMWMFRFSLFSRVLIFS